MSTDGRIHLGLLFDDDFDDFDFDDDVFFDDFVFDDSVHLIDTNAYVFQIEEEQKINFSFSFHSVHHHLQ